MAKELSTRERFLRVLNHQTADRVPIIDSPWSGTIRRWVDEGMPAADDWRRYLGTDITLAIGANLTPRLPVVTVDETDEYITRRTEWGAVQRSFKQKDSTPEFLDFQINSYDAWLKIKDRMAPADDRVNWPRLDAAWKAARADDQWIQMGFWFGFDITHSWAVGTETVLVAMLEQPEWIIDMLNTELDLSIAMAERIWDRGYAFDAINWPDDMGYKGTAFFSRDIYREIIKPVHRRACDWAHQRGLKVELHSCGNINALLDDLIEIGVDCLNPLEVKAGMDPIALKDKYGGSLAFRGGVNAVLWDDCDAILAEIERVMPVLKQNGGYIFSSDHSIPSTVSLDNMKAIVARVKELGAY